MTQNTGIEALLQQGHELLFRGHYQVALGIFQQVVKMEAQNPQVLYKLALACHKLYDHHESVKYLNQALEIHKDYIPALALRGLAYKELNQNDNAKTDFDRVIAIKPNDYEDLRGQCIAFAELQQYEQALASIDKAVKLKPDSHEAWMYHGISLASLGRHEQALASIDKAVKLKPDSHEAWMYHGISLASLGRHEQALASIDKAVKLKPDSHEAWMYHGISLASLGRHEQALASIDKAVKLKPDSHEAWMYHGISLASLGRHEQALASIDKAVKLKPDSYKAWMYYGITLVSLKHLEEAVDSYDQAIEINPDYEDAWRRRSYAIFELNRLKRFEFTLTSWEKVLKIKPKNAENWFYHGKTLINLGQVEKAIDSYDKAIEISPGYAEAWKCRGLALKHLGRLEEAIDNYDKAIEFAPDDTEAWYELGNLLEDLGDLEDAFDSYNEAVKIDPNYKEAWYSRSKVLLRLNHHLEALGSYECTLTLAPKNYYALNGKGLALVSLVRYSEAIAAYRESIYYSKKQYWRAWHNLGWAIINSGKSYKLAIKNWTDGLKALRPEIGDYYQEGCGVLHHSIGKVYNREGRNQRKRDYWHKAKKNYEKALKFLENNPKLGERYLEVLQDLYCIYLNWEEIEKAEELQRIGADLLRRLLAESKHPGKKKQLARKFVGFNQLTVDLYAQLNQLVKALETAEEGKNACLTWLLSGWSEEFPTPSWDRIQQLANSTTALVYWHLSPAALTTFIIKHDAPKPILITFSPPTNPEELPIPMQRLQEFEDWDKEWNQLYSEYRKGNKQEGGITNSWRDLLPEMITRLGKILNIPTILSQLNNIGKLILIPHRDLHRFPLHVLFPETFTITYLPCAQLGINLLGKEARIERSLLSVEHPDSKGFYLLPHAEIESAAITQLFNHPTPKRISGQEATKIAVKDALTNGYSIFHFTGHGSYDSQHPKQSALALSGEDYLTLEEICNINLSGYQLVSLSACETAITGNQTITEEYVGLISAFLYQHVRYVISTLWTVTDDASSLLMIYCYWQMKKGKSPSISLAKATKWLRNLTDRKLERLYKIIFAQLSPDDKPLRPFLRRKLDQYSKMNLSQKKQKRFSDPYYWAAFTITSGYN
ncbi:tetratricopeptide repeat protein [Scytonema sp. UIC 10036]|uniref:tetratricopeptide repeat protein n=1 Tax=Scytonema sp. UIC 10036 TaxID=2304196 RepID=UPI0012DA8072|nr:CHAT domain-containing protein [Scytonema sp. UIC 10036]MUG92359.1 tetratricopeptide repeat protein [Scytonema sp. UIC 10036]